MDNQAKYYERSHGIQVRHGSLSPYKQRILYSFNIGDYCQIHAEYLNAGKAHAGIILASQRRFGIGEQMRRLLRDAKQSRIFEQLALTEFVGWVRRSRNPPNVPIGTLRCR